MKLNVALNCLAAKWRAYLTNRGHHIYTNRRGARLIRSRNGKNTQYRWLLLVGTSPERMLTKPEIAHIRREFRRASQRKESAYLVVGFATEPGRIIVTPARIALKNRRIYSDRGGISWC